MAAALGTVRFQGNSGHIHSISVYLNDTTNALATWDESKVAVAGSPNKYVVKETGFLVDVALTTDLATPTHLQISRNGQPTGTILDCTAQLASVVSRPSPRLAFTAGMEISITQVA